MIGWQSVDDSQGEGKPVPELGFLEKAELGIKTYVQAVYLE